MNIVFGNLVGEFNGYFMPGTTVTEAQFKASVNKLRYEGQKRLVAHVLSSDSLYIVYLFIAKFCLTYFAMVGGDFKENDGYILTIAVLFSRHRSSRISCYSTGIRPGPLLPADQ